ncbi:MAG TPA: hypothetical protein VN038_13350 [Dyadobacter sp.]|nr:hypothetical protein [Dyadobacter sp.]
MTNYQSWFEQIQRSETYARLVKRLFDDAIKELIRMGYSVDRSRVGPLSYDPDKPFKFSDFPQLNARLNKLLKDLHDKVTATILNGIAKSWESANVQNDNLVKAVLKNLNVPDETLRKYSNRNLESLKTFQDRKVAGMNLSGRVWNLTEQIQQSLEMALDIGLGEGRTAQQLSQDVRQYLNEPDKLFRRVRDKWGVLQLSKASKAYRPGQGVYRSAYKNAMRLTRTETNMGYRKSDHERWKNMDFIVGFEVQRSNHVYPCDVCDTFVGKYPKSYVFVGQHPHCRCRAIPILATEEEMEEFFASQIQGETAEIKSQNRVTSMPQPYMDWIKNNEKRILKSSNVPYFIKDNFKDGDITKGLKFTL